MGITPTELIWHNGQFVPWHEAKVHVLAHGLHYGSSVFEGVRSYETPRGPAVFRLTDHLRRLFDSARIYRMTIPYTLEHLVEACKQTISRNRLGASYLRPVVYRGFGTFSLAPGNATPIEVAIAAIRWGAYLGQEALEKGVDVCVSSWIRPPSAAFPVLAKAGGHYLNAQLIASEAARHGYVEGIALDSNGTLSEGSSENLFLVKNGTVYTPPLAASILGGITRDTVLTLARAANIPIVEQAMPREMLYIADEVFFTGTAAEITPVRSVDGLLIGQGKAGPVTTSLQSAFFGLFSGQTDDRWGWLELVHEHPRGPQAEFASGVTTA